MILVDTSVWVEHLRAGSDRLTSLLFDEQVLCHSYNKLLDPLLERDRLPDSA